MRFTIYRLLFEWAQYKCSICHHINIALRIGSNKIIKEIKSRMDFSVAQFLMFYWSSSD